MALVPAFFEPYAEDIVARVPMRDGLSVLETACGTGIVTESLRKALPNSTRMIATDLNEGMVTFGRQRLGTQAAVEWKVADAMALPFDDDATQISALTGAVAAALARECGSEPCRGKCGRSSGERLVRQL